MQLAFAHCVNVSVAEASSVCSLMCVCRILFNKRLKIEEDWSCILRCSVDDAVKLLLRFRWLSARKVTNACWRWGKRSSRLMAVLTVRHVVFLDRFFTLRMSATSWIPSASINQCRRVLCSVSLRCSSAVDAGDAAVAHISKLHGVYS